MSRTLPSALCIAPNGCAPVLLINAAAGNGRARHNLTRIRRVLESRGCRFDFVETRSRNELEDQTVRLVEEGRRVFFAVGGDGTLQGLVQAVLGRSVIIGIIPAGSGNDFAAALGFPPDPARAAQMLFDCEPRRVDTVMARTADGNERVYLGGGGIGLDAEAAGYAANHYRGWPGRVRYVAAALHALKDFETLRVRVRFWTPASGQAEGDVLVACVLNSPTYGGGLRIAPDARVDDGMVDLTLLDDMSFWKVARLLPRLLTGGDISTPGMQRMRCVRARLEPDRPCFFHGDGEIFGPAPVDIEVMHQAISVLAPRRRETAG